MREGEKTTVGRLRGWSPRSCSRVVSLCVMLLGANGIASAQELTPRAFWPTPLGTKFLVAAYGYTTGDVITDPSLPLVGLDSQIGAAVIAYGQTISLAGRTASLQFELPYVDGTSTGVLFGEQRDRGYSGLGDFSATLAVNLMGAPSMGLDEFLEFRRNPQPILGTSLRIVAPTGEYEPDKLINIGTNRWAAKAKLAYLQPFKKKWIFELAGGAWFFQDNDEFLGTTREQKPIVALDLSVVRRFRPGFWASIDANYYFGGRTTVGGEKRADLQRNSRLGISVGYPIKGRHSIKASANAGVVTQSGGDFNTYVLTYVFRLN